jgi:hypothetical protein
MRKAHRISRIGTFALGLGVGAAMASMPPIASADSVDSADIATYLPDFGAVAAAAATITPPTLPDDFSNFAVSISGIPLIQLGTASATSTFGNIAIAQGSFSDANAASGLFNYATADGDNSLAVVGDTGSFNYASATGDHASAIAAWGSGNTAITNGDFSYSQAGASVVSGVYDSNFNTATAEGSHAIAYAGWDGSDSNTANAIGDNVQVYDPEGSPFGAAATDNWFTELMSSLGGGSTVGDSGNWFTDLVSSLDGSAAAESSNWVTELLATFDGGSAAADGANFWTELTTLF